MSLRIRLRQHGRKNRKMYRIVVAEVRAPRDGRYLECVGWVNPFALNKSESHFVKSERILHWVEVGAVPTGNAVNFIRKSAPEAAAFMARRLENRRVKKRNERKRASLRRKAVQGRL